MFEEILDFSVTLAQSIQDVARDIFAFFDLTLNEIMGLSSSLAFMSMPLYLVFLGSGLTAFLTYKIISFIVGILP